MRITLANDGVSATIYDWSYENTPGMAIAAPEPSRVALLLGGLLVTFFKRSRPRP
ncbi:MAG: PEP-CTERM sorting domain-containing protein [Verrucomicrobiaceae bacterium]|nr:PEP-CTERM sorting domain-containing protein [Verrucomicrobiaceae bacterium]